MSEALKAWRLKKGWSQEAAARFLDRSLRQYQRYEDGTAEVPTWIAKLIK